MKAPVENPSWDAETRALYQHDLEQSWDPSRQPHVYHCYQNQLREYMRLVTGPRLRVLDVGCAQGTLAMQLAEAGHDVTAVDIRQHFLDYAASRYERGQIRFLCANILNDEIDGEYDLVFANQIIEHLVYPEALLSRLRARLAPGGRLVVATPNHAYFINRLPSFAELGDPQQWEYMQFTADGDGHFYLYTGDELLAAFRKVGFQTSELRFFETPWISGHYKVRFLHRVLPEAILRGLDHAVLAIPALARRFSHQMMVIAQR